MNCHSRRSKNILKQSRNNVLSFFLSEAPFSCVCLLLDNLGEEGWPSKRETYIAILNSMIIPKEKEELLNKHIIDRFCGAKEYAYNRLMGFRSTDLEVDTWNSTYNLLIKETFSCIEERKELGAIIANIIKIQADDEKLSIKQLKSIYKKYISWIKRSSYVQHMEHLYTIVKMKHAYELEIKNTLLDNLPVFPVLFKNPRHLKSL